MNYLAKLLLYSTQEQDFDKIIDMLFQTIKEELGVQSVGFYWHFNHEWYFSGDTDSQLSKQMREMILSLIKSTHWKNDNMMVNANLSEHKSIATLIPVYLHNEFMGSLGLVTVPENHVMTTKKTELSIFSYHLALILSQEIERFRNKEYQHAIIQGLIAIIESLDPYLRDHSKNVANYALLLAKELKIEPSMAENIYYAGLFHDIGKVSIPVTLLQKPDSLTPEEYEIIKQHPTKGAYILEQFSIFKSIVPIVCHHHEMWEGGGYPDGAKGADIPFGSRLIAVVDAYDALTTNRIYRKAQGEKTALDVIIKNTPQQFDPEIVEAFIRVAKNL